MAFDRSDYEALLRRTLEQNRESQRAEHARVQQAAVAIENLTGHPTWDYFLSRLQARREQLLSEREQYASELLSERVDSIGQSYAKVMYRSATAAIEALDFVLALPKQMIDAAQESKATLDEPAESKA